MSFGIRARGLLFKFEMISYRRMQLLLILLPMSRAFQFEIVPLLAFASKLEFELLILLVNFAYEDVVAACGWV